MALLTTAQNTVSTRTGECAVEEDAGGERYEREHANLHFERVLGEHANLHFARVLEKAHCVFFF